MLITNDMTQDSGGGGAVAERGRHRVLDQFYTRPEVAAACMEHVMRVTGGHAGLWLEPSAGTGSFLDLLPTPRLGIDLDHEIRHPEIVADTNFLGWDGYADLPQPIVTVGNPPFGRNSSLALKFLNRATMFSRHVCMILPRTFQKEALKAKVNMQFELAHDEALEPFAFIHDGRPYDVPCCFQIWSKIQGSGLRQSSSTRQLTHSDFDFIDSPLIAHFAFQRVGARAGLVSTEGLSKSWKSHYFVYVKDETQIDVVRRRLAGIDWSEVRARTAGNPSIGKGELIDAYTAVAGPSKDPQPSFDF